MSIEKKTKKLNQIDTASTTRSVHPLESTSPSIEISKVTSLGEVTLVDQLDTNLLELAQLKATEAVGSVSSLPELSSVEQTDFPSVGAFFDHLIAEQQGTLQRIAEQVQHQELSEDEAEDQLLLLALTTSLNIPEAIAKTMLPTLKESVTELAGVRSGLKKLWRTPPSN